MTQSSNLIGKKGNFVTMFWIAGLSLLIGSVAAAGQPKAHIEYISPTPNSVMVSQQTNIIIRTAENLDPAVASDPGLLVVEGLKSGAHPGSLVLSDDHKTLVFEPFRAFSAGEAVTVNLKAGMHAQNGEDIGPIKFNFTVSPLSSFDQQMLLTKLTDRFVPREPRMPSGGLLGPNGLWKMQSDSLPRGFPRRTVLVSGSTAPGMLFLASFKIAEASNHLNFISLVPSDQQYLMILDNAGMPVYYRKMPSMSTDFKLQMNGYLTYFDNAAGAYFELDSNYAVIDSFRCGNGYRTDLHELRVMPDGHQLMLGYDPEIVDMSAIVPGGDPQATVIGTVIQELDRNRHVIFQWRSFDHFQVTDATREDLTAGTIDYVHPNTIEIDSDGNLLLSSRHMDEITKINRKTGDIIWRWGGKNNQFKYVGDSVGFSHQHTIRHSQSGTLILFDNGNYRVSPYSRMIEYSVDEVAQTVRSVWQYRHTPDIFAIAMGSVDRLSNGNTLIGWGTASPAVTEIRPDGSTAFELQLPDSLVSYRVFRMPWKQATLVSDIREGHDIPISLMLAQNYPNPFNPTTKIQFGLPKQTIVTLVVYDLLGRKVATLIEGVKPAGMYSVSFDGSKLASGTYVYRMSTPDADLSRLMILLK